MSLPSAAVTGGSVGSGARPTARPGAVLAVVCLGVVLATLDLVIVNIAFPAIGRSFGGAGLGPLSWVLNAYTIVFAALLVPAGRLADLVGRKAGFLVGVAVFTVSSGLCALADDVPQLVAARVLQAAGAALLTPASLGLLLAAFPPERRAGAVRIWGAMSGVAAAIGPVVGGVLVNLDWRWIFLVNVPVGVVALVLGVRVLPSVPRQPERLPDLVRVRVDTSDATRRECRARSVDSDRDPSSWTATLRRAKSTFPVSGQCLLRLRRLAAI